MSLEWNITLWTLSLILAISGIIFGIIASINSSHANKSIKDLITTKGVEDSARRFFFDNLKLTITANRKSIKYLQAGKTSYIDYSIVNTPSRMNFIDSETVALLKESDYANLINSFEDTKERLEKMFAKTIGGLKKLSSNEIMTAAVRKKLVEYHSLVITASTDIVREFTNSSGSTKTVDIKSK